MIKSNLDVAYEIMQKSKSSVPFNELWQEVCKIQGYSEEEAKTKMGKFYTNLFMDGRFVALEKNNWEWNLRDRYTFDLAHIDLDNDEDEDSDNEADSNDNMSDDNESYNSDYDEDDEDELDDEDEEDQDEEEY